MPDLIVVSLLWSFSFVIIKGTLLRFQGDGLAFNWRGVALVQASNAAFALGQVGYRHLARRMPDWQPQSSLTRRFARGS